MVFGSVVLVASGCEKKKKKEKNKKRNDKAKCFPFALCFFGYICFISNHMETNWHTNMLVLWK